MPTTDPIELPVLGALGERADAARNRQRILVAARCLIARNGIAHTSMDAIAAEAGVGKGTLFRRFGDRASLAMALMDEPGRGFQEAFIRGPAPLGPGAPPCDRLVAFGRGLLELTAQYGELLLEGQTAGAAGTRFGTELHGAYYAHVAMLVRDAAPDLDADYVAEVLLASLSAEVVVHQLARREMTLDRLVAGWECLVRRVLTGDAVPGGY